MAKLPQMSTARRGAAQPRRRLEISLCHVSVRRGAQWVLDDVSLRLVGTDRWVLLGDNGAGKTQFLKLLATDVWPTPTGCEVLSFRRGGRPIDRTSAKRHIAYIGAERQDQYARYGWNLEVRDVLATGLHGTDLLLEPATPAERRRVSRMLRVCGLTPLAARPFLSLSYGQKRLVLLARALIREPDWLLLDEFYNGLDEHYRRRVDRLLDAAHRRGQSWIVAAHRALDVPRGTTRLLEIAHGRVTASKSLPRARLRQLEHAAGDPADADAPEVVLEAASPPPTRRSKLLLRLCGADLYVDYKLVLRDLSWDLRAGEHWALIGANGSGKSSMLKLLYGDLAPAFGGRIERCGVAAGLAIEAWKRRVGYLSPELQADYCSDISLLDLVASGRHASIGLAQAPSAADRRAALRWLRFFGLSTLAQRRPREVSYGQLRRALIARALAGEPRLLLLDEPLTGLDPRQRATVKHLLERLMTGRVTLVIAVHRTEDVPRGIERGLRLHKCRAHPINLGSANGTGRRQDHGPFFATMPR